MSAYALGLNAAAPSLDDPAIEKLREQRGGQLAPLPYTQTRWYLSDVETATHLADAGDMSLAAQLWRSCRRDGIIAGVLSTRTGGLVRLPKKFRGHKGAVEDLELGNDSIRSTFDEMFPPTELGLLAADGLGLGVGVAEIQPVQGRDFGVMVRLDPQFLLWRHSENRWYYRTIAGTIPITPGDGRWILHTPGGRIAPWQHGLWQSVGESWIHKTHAKLHDSNWQSKLANPARVAVSPQGASEEQQESWFQRVMAWGVNTVFGMRPGYDVKLLESNGRGHEAFQTTIDRSDRESIIAIAGQEVTTDGGAGFQNSDIHKSIRADLIKETADALAYTINTQGIPAFVIERYGIDALVESAVVEWDVTPPKDRAAEATALTAAGNAIVVLDKAFKPHGFEVDPQEMADRFGVRIRKIMKTGGDTVKLDLAQTDIAKVVRVDEVRKSQGLDGIGDERGDLTIGEIDDGNGEAAA